MPPARAWRVLSAELSVRGGALQGLRQAIYFPPRLICRECKSREFETLPAEAHRQGREPTRSSAPRRTEFAGQAPFAVGIVEMDDGVRLTCQIVDVELRRAEGRPAGEARVPADLLRGRSRASSTTATRRCRCGARRTRRRAGRGERGVTTRCGGARRRGRARHPRPPRDPQRLQRRDARRPARRLPRAARRRGHPRGRARPARGPPSAPAPTCTGCAACSNYSYERELRGLPRPGADAARDLRRARSR